MRTFSTPGTARTAASASRPICAAAFWFSVWKRTVKETLPPSTLTSWTNPNDKMSRDSPGNLTPLSASRICSFVGIRFLLNETFVRGADDRNGFFVRADHRDRVHVLRTGQPPRDHDLVDPVDQTGPHCTDQDQRMLGDVLDLNELPHHEQLQGRSDAPGQDDEGRRKADEVVQPRKEGPVPEDFVHERIGVRLRGEMDGQSERAR